MLVSFDQKTVTAALLKQRPLVVTSVLMQICYTYRRTSQFLFSPGKESTLHYKARFVVKITMMRQVFLSIVLQVPRTLALVDEVIEPALSC